MASASTQFGTDILQQAMALPAAARLSLASQIIQSLDREQKRPGGSELAEAETPELARGSIANIIGLWADVHPQPTDEEIERILEDERLRKFGV